MAIPMLEVQIKNYEVGEKEWRVHYKVTSRSTDPLFLVQHQRLPFLRLASTGTMLEIWMGVPPLSEIEQNRDINSLILPGTMELPPGDVVNETAIVKRPLKQSGYWLEESEEIAIPLEKQAEMKALIIQGFGLSALDPRRVRSIDQLFAWQSTARSQVITVKLPPSAP
jgi:hypothetical protein